MREIWRTQLLRQIGPQPVEMPVGSKIVHVGTKYGDIGVSIWYEFPVPEEGKMVLPKEEHVFQIFGTGYDEIPDDGWTHIGTGLGRDGVYVWHVYALEEE